MLKSVYAKGAATHSKCTHVALVNFLKQKKKEGYTLHFIHDDEKGTIVPCDSMTINQVVECGQTAILKSKKQTNIIVTRKLRDDERNSNDVVYGSLTHMYDIISVCDAPRYSQARHNDQLRHLG